MNQRRIVVALVAAAFAITAAVAITLRDVNTTGVSNDTPPGTVGLARPHPPLDRAPAQELPVSR